MLKSRRALLLMGCVAALVAGPPLWNAVRSRLLVRQDGSTFAGFKFGDTGRPGAGPEVAILSPEPGRAVRRGDEVEVLVRLERAPGGDWPSRLLLSIEWDGESFGSSFPQGEPQADGTYLCRWRMNVPRRPGRYRLVATCQDIIMTGPFASPADAKTHDTTEAAVELTVD